MNAYQPKSEALSKVIESTLPHWITPTRVGSSRKPDGRLGRWRTSFGAWPERDGVRFRVWAPECEAVDVVLLGDKDGSDNRSVRLERFQDGTWGAHVPGVRVGSRYRYRIGDGDHPDPASRYQPEGPHGPSEVVDPYAFRWSDASWCGIDRKDLVIYEIHVGTFSPEGTFEGITRRLPYLRQLGVTAIELMPVADFPGQRNWGYDGVDLFAPAHVYGTPDDLRRLVDEAHHLGLAVILDVVYNHLGPDGNFIPAFTPYIFSEKHDNPWGKALNFDGQQSSMVRRFFIENAMHWIHEYHLDGLRLDATHAIIDDSSVPFLAELSTRVRESAAGRRTYLFAEDHRNLNHMLRPEAEGGWGLDGVWADDFHHTVRVALAKDDEGYYRDFEGTTTEIADAVNRGWLYSGQYAEYLQEHRGTDPAGLDPRKFLVCIQNHDQIGNRAMGERLHHQIDHAAFRAATALLLCSPATPLLFMGQEWAASTPFQFFTDHNDELGQAVTEGRRREFRHFKAFADEAAREQIPDPQADSTFTASQLNWEELAKETHHSMLRLYQSLLALRRTDPGLRNDAVGSFQSHALTETTLLLRRDAQGAASLLAVIHLDGAADVDLAKHAALDGLAASRFQLILTTEDQPFATDPQPPTIDLSGPAPRITFRRPSAVLLRMWGS